MTHNYKTMEVEVVDIHVDISLSQNDRNSSFLQVVWFDLNDITFVGPNERYMS